MRAGELALQMADNADLIARFLFPDGKREGREWRVGSIAGEPGHSLGICIEGTKAGIWSDFSTGAAGDLLDLWMQAKNISLIEAMQATMDYLGVQDSKPKFFKKETVWQKPKKPNCESLKKKSKALEYLTVERKLTQETLDLFKIADGKDCIVFPYIRDEKAVMIKTLKLERKNGKKEIKPTSQGQEPCLFGWQAIDQQSRQIVICEGEIDAMSLKQIGVNALSVPFGAGKGQNWIENEYDRINRLDEIFICMDNDEPGEIAQKEISERLGQYRCKVLSLGQYKDANEALQAGYDIFNLQADMRDAKTCDPSELRQLSDFHDQIMDEFYPKTEKQVGALLPWGGDKKSMFLRAGEISVWSGFNSHGKSICLSQVMIECVAQGYRVCVASMEMSPADTGQKMYQQIGGIDKPSDDYARQIQSFVHDGVWIFNLYGTAKADRILDVFKYAFYRYGVKHFVVDSLAKCGLAEDDYNGQKKFIDQLMEFAGKHNVHVHVVVHVRKKQDESAIPGKMDVKGTGGVTDMVDNLFVIWRNKKRESAMAGTDEKAIEKYKNQPDVFLSCEKQRKTGQEPTYPLWFHPGSCQFLNYEKERPKQYIF